MNKILTMTLSAAFAAVACTAMPALAANADCDKKAEEKKLAGAAKTSFLKKCEADAGAPGLGAKDAGAACAKSANDKKLAGAAKTSFMKKCESDA
ncbi:MAG TPA: hypothetical protein VK570_01635, partial [Rubrivivax sp.]|nr:hypothetical protein [Rubrivivax sp.]